MIRTYILYYSTLITKYKQFSETIYQQSTYLFISFIPILLIKPTILRHSQLRVAIVKSQNHLFSTENNRFCSIILKIKIFDTIWHHKTHSLAHSGNIKTHFWHVLALYHLSKNYRIQGNTNHLPPYTIDKHLKTKNI